MVATLTRPPVTEQRPRLVGDGPAECSSCTELSVLPYIVWDVNRYYAELGVFPWATRRELREAYQAKRGQDNARLTYVIKQLLDPVVRREYDSMPYGSVYMDRYVQEALKRQMLDTKSDRMQALHDLGVDLDSVDGEAIERDIYAEMGLMVEPEDTPLEMVDSGASEAQDGPRPADPFLYAYYLYKVAFPGRETVSRLSEWQRFLVSALAREGINITFAVGLHGDPHPCVYAEVGYRKVFFLSDRQVPTEELAARAAGQYRKDFGPQQYTNLAITGS